MQRERTVVDISRQSDDRDPTPSKVFQPLHPPDALDQLDPSSHLGPVDPLSMPEPENTGPTPEEQRIATARKSLPSVDGMFLLDDFEHWAEKVMSGSAWAYYKSAADREISESLWLPSRRCNEESAHPTCQALLRIRTHSGDTSSDRDCCETYRRGQ